MSDDCRHVSGFDNCSHQPLYWKHLRKHAANESVYKEFLSSLTRAIFKTVTAQQKYEGITSLTVPTSTHSPNSDKGDGFKRLLAGVAHRTCFGENITENHTYC
jgi:hypothetical protein